MTFNLAHAFTPPSRKEFRNFRHVGTDEQRDTQSESPTPEGCCTHQVPAAVRWLPSAQPLLTPIAMT